MTARTIDTATASVFAAPARPARLRRWLAWLQNLTVRVELDPHLADDIGQKSYDAPVLPHGWAQAFQGSALQAQALARQQEDAAEIERCERSYDAPVLEASWAQATREAASRPGALHRVVAILSGKPNTLAADPVEAMDRHIARDIGIELELLGFNQVQVGGGRYV